MGPSSGKSHADLAGFLQQAAIALGLALPAGFASQVDTYLDELERWERIGRLTAYRARAARARHLVVESLMLLSVLPEPAAPLLDIGSGAGVPGLILKLARPDWEVVLVDATRRRVNFLRQVIRRLDLGGVRVEWGRAEALARTPLAGRFRTVTMRAVTAGDTARMLATPFLAPRGVLVLPLAPNVATRGGDRRVVVINVPGELPYRREFHIILQADLGAGVSRGTIRKTSPQHRGGEPEGRRRKDDDRG